MTLTEFLLARLAEDEAVAGATRDSHDPLDWTNYTEAPAVGLEGPVDGPSGYSSLVIDPARVLAEVEAKRRIVAMHEDPDCDDQRFGPIEWELPEGQTPVTDGMVIASQRVLGCETLAHLASVYADHPDYRDEWRA
jgi:hypothetical protein